MKATIKYSEVAEKIRPLEIELSKLDKKLEASRLRLKECEEQLNDLNFKVNNLKQNFAKKTSEAERLRQDLQKAEETLSRAKNLLEKLYDEKNRWEFQANSIDMEIKNYPYDCMLGAAFTIYLCDADENIREQVLTSEWGSLSGGIN